MKPVTGGFPATHRLKIKAQFDWVFSRPNQRCSHGVLQAIFKPSSQPVDPDGATSLEEQASQHHLSPVNSLEINSLSPKKASNRPPPGPRLGLIIAKRFLPRAVDRNRLKRLIREGFRAHRSELPNVDIIVRLVRRPDREVSAGEVTMLFGKMQRPQSTTEHNTGK